MHSHALPLCELHRQELLIEAAYERRLEQLNPVVAAESQRLWRVMADVRQGIATALASLRPAAHLPSHVTVR